MADIEKSEDEKALDGGDTRNHQPEHAENSENMLRPWMKNLGKKYYQNEYLGNFESLPDAVDALMRRPEPKEVPDSYGESEEVEKAYKAAGLTKKEAEAISAAYRPSIAKPKEDLEKHFGDDYRSVMDEYGKGISSFADDMRQKITEEGLDKDPLFVSIMARVGKETGQNEFIKGRNAKPDGKKSGAEKLVREAYGL